MTCSFAAAALIIEKASTVTMVRSLNIIISFIIQANSEEKPQPTEGAGALLVLLAILLVAMESQVGPESAMHDLNYE